MFSHQLEKVDGLTFALSSTFPKRATSVELAALGQVALCKIRWTKTVRDMINIMFFAYAAQALPHTSSTSFQVSVDDFKNTRCHTRGTTGANRTDTPGEQTNTLRPADTGYIPLYLTSNTPPASLG